MHGFVAIDGDGSEWIFEAKPVSMLDKSDDKPYWKVDETQCNDSFISLPRGTVQLMLKGLSISYKNGPVELHDDGRYIIMGCGTVQSYDNKHTLDMLQLKMDKGIKTTYEMPQFSGVTEYTNAYIHLFKIWCEDNNAYYYSRPKEDFNEFEARELAEKYGASILLLENLS